MRPGNGMNVPGSFVAFSGKERFALHFSQANVNRPCVMGDFGAKLVNCGVWNICADKSLEGADLEDAALLGSQIFFRLLGGGLCLRA